MWSAMGQVMVNKKHLYAVCMILFLVGSPINSQAQSAGDGGKSPELQSTTPKVMEVDISDIRDDELFMTDDHVQDDFEDFNRAMFSFNEVLDALVFKPLSQVYEMVIPEWGRDRIRSALSNLHEPVYAVNHILQGDMEKAGDNIGRFLTNSTWGLLGLMDVASEAKVSPQPTDFGLTLKKAGVKTGSYLVLPVIGPSTLRDAPGLMVDTFMDPWGYYKFNSLDHPSRTHDTFMVARYSLEAIDKRQRFTKVLDNIEKTSIDKYATIRSIYFQKR